jgi:hypothetical protein
MRFALANSCSSETVGLKFVSATRFRSPDNTIGFELTYPLGIDVFLRNSPTGFGISKVAAGLVVSAFRFVAFATPGRLGVCFAGAFFFVTLLDLFENDFKK